MKNNFLCLFAILVWMSVVSPQLQARPASDSARAPRAIELQDILAWKRIQAVVVSPNGDWFSYRLVPTEGDGEVVVRNTRSDKEVRFPAGEAPAVSEGSIAFSEDSRWLAFTVYPKSKDSKKAKKDKKPLFNKLSLLNLSTEKTTSFDKIKSFSFSGEAATWIAVQGAPGEGQEKEKWSGSDLLLRELATGNQLNIGNVTEYAFNKKGSWLAWIIDAQDKGGNGVALRNVPTGWEENQDLQSRTIPIPTRSQRSFGGSIPWKT